MTKLAGTFVPRAPLSVNGCVSDPPSHISIHSPARPFIDGPFFAAWRVFCSLGTRDQGGSRARLGEGFCRAATRDDGGRRDRPPLPLLAATQLEENKCVDLFTRLKQLANYSQKVQG